MAVESLRDSLRRELQRRGAHFCTAEEGRRLRAAVWPGGVLARSVVGRSATEIAEQAGVDVKPGTRLLVCSVLAASEQDPLCREKLSPILGMAHVRDFEDAVKMVCRLTGQFGRGHSCGIHTNRPEQICHLARAVKTSRLMVNQSTGAGNSGSFSNGMPFTTTLSCGTWGGSLVGENVNWRNFLNYTWVSRPIDRPKTDWSQLVAPYVGARA
ncbi:hypothetical protein GCM10008171_27080 [Methylopila jiangsuensis]|uniref:Aldehyde dehydrogenase family protein n=1 Tax=Methylopila jiangsuensis TaxID=586230 RepID=A0A9W6N3V7_9HYPH|nr:hypothetical protein GCM10008171_27080 [Methylopila jiangsuensis]